MLGCHDFFIRISAIAALLASRDPQRNWEGREKFNFTKISWKTFHNDSGGPSITFYETYINILRIRQNEIWHSARCKDVVPCAKFRSDLIDMIDIIARSYLDYHVGISLIIMEFPGISNKMGTFRIRNFQMRFLGLRCL